MWDYTISDHEISVPGYDLVRNDRHRNGGGVVLYIRDSINFNIRHDLMIDSLELLSVGIFKPKVKSFIINTWYRPPNALFDIFDDFEFCIQKVIQRIRRLFLFEISIVIGLCLWNNDIRTLTN